MSILVPPAPFGPEWDEDEPPHWVDDEPDLPLAFAPFAPVRLPEAPEGVSDEVRDTVWQWRLAARRRAQAEAVEAAAGVQAEDVFRAEFAPAKSDADWFEDGGYKTFLADAADVMRCGTVTAGRRISDARYAMDRLPQTWALCAAGEVPQNQLAAVVKEAGGLDPDLCPVFDDAVVEILTGQPGSRLPRLLAAARETIQARTADERHEKARVHRSVSLEPGRDGMGVLRLEGPLDKLAALDQAVHTAAVAAHGHAGETRSIGQLRYDIVEDVLFDGIRISAAGVRAALLGVNPESPQRGQNVPQRKQVIPTVVLHVPALTLLGRSDELPTIDGIGPVPPSVAKRICADAPSFYRVLTHPVTGTRITLDRTTYTPPADLRRWIQVRDEYCRFPGCTRPAHQCDIDHIRGWHDTGVTNQDNLIALSRDKHVLKSMGLYRIDGDPNGTITFTSPMGVKHSSRPRPPAQAAPPTIRDWATHALDENDCPY